MELRFGDDVVGHHGLGDRRVGGSGLGVTGLKTTDRVAAVCGALSLLLLPHGTHGRRFFRTWSEPLRYCAVGLGLTETVVHLSGFVCQGSYLGFYRATPFHKTMA